MCLFCKIINQEIPASILYEDETTLAILDIAQATKGHTLILPKAHYPSLLEIPEDLANQMLTTAVKVSKLLMVALQAEGCNILTNINEVAGQTVFHAHIHILPRYKNDDLAIKFTAHEYDLPQLLNEILTASSS